MGTTLTGTTPQDTYDSLIKVTDNGPLSGTLKALSDGLGNDSTLSLSTTAASIAGTLAVSGNATFDTNTLFVDATNNRVGVGITTPDSKVRIQNDNATVPSLTIRDGGTPTVDHIRVSSGTYGDAFFVGATGLVGIGTSAPNAKLQVNVSNATATVRIKGGLDTITAIGQINSQLDFGSNDTSVFETDGVACRIASVNESNNGANVGLGFYTYTQPAFSEKVRITSTGVLSLNQGQIQFPSTQVPSADPNTLDDYEEGTWTPASNSAGYTLSSSEGSYTKIGRQVTIRGRVNFSAINASSTSVFIFTGLPFTPSSEFQGVCRENTDLGSIFMAQVRSVPDGVLNSMDAVTSGSNVQFATSRNYIFTITYFV